MSAAHAIEMRGIGKRYDLGRAAPFSLFGKRTAAEKEVWALRDIDLTVKRGERVGVIGRNGAGKSTLLKILSRVAYPSVGEACIRGRLTALLEVGSGFSEQLTGRENIFLNASLHGLSRAEVAAKLDEIIEFAELHRFIDTPIKYYSSGMRSRLGFAVAAHLDPDVLLLDEVLAVGDLAFQRKCLDRMGDLTSGGRTLLFVSHSMDSVTRFCDRCVWLDGGRIVADGAADSVTQAYADQALALRPEAKWERAAPTTRDVAFSDAPWGDPRTDAARLLGARVLNAHGTPTAHVFADESFMIEVEYELVADDVVVLPGLRFYNETRDLIFTGVYARPHVETWRRSRGLYASRATIPAHLMNVGRHSVSIGLNTPGASTLIRHHVEEDALSFTVHEPQHGRLSARGAYREVKGAVRPLLAWETTALSASRDGAAIATRDRS